jgi:hypothetical protein
LISGEGPDGGGVFVCERISIAGAVSGVTHPVRETKKKYEDTDGNIKIVH